MTISRTAQCVALGLFPMGKCHEVRFRSPMKIGKKCQEGLDELVSAGMVSIEKDRHGITYHGTEKIGRPMCDFKPIVGGDPEEMFPIIEGDEP